MRYQIESQSGDNSRVEVESDDLAFAIRMFKASHKSGVDISLIDTAVEDEMDCRGTVLATAFGDGLAETELHIFDESVRPALADFTPRESDVLNFKRHAFRALAVAGAANGWIIEGEEPTCEGSDYVTFSRGEDIVKVRISDHASRVHGRAAEYPSDYSIEYKVSESSHSLANVLTRLQRAVASN